MKRLYFLFIFIFLAINIGYTQQLGIKGSFVIVAIGSDGIMVASETRGNIYNRDDFRQTSLAHFEQVQKTFVVQDKAFAITGNMLIGDTFFNSILNNYKKTLTDTLPLDDLLPSFVKYCRKNLAKNDYEEVLSNVIFSAGYQDGAAGIRYTQDGMIGLIDSTGFVSTDKSMFSTMYDPAMDCATLGRLAERAITQYATEYTSDEVIGGPVRTLWIKPNNQMVWLKNRPSDNTWKSLAEFVEDCKNKKVILTYTSNQNRETMRRLMQ